MVALHDLATMKLDDPTWDTTTITKTATNFKTKMIEWQKENNLGDTEAEVAYAKLTREIYTRLSQIKSEPAKAIALQVKK
jgi:hypothetical protein